MTSRSRREHKPTSKFLNYFTQEHSPSNEKGLKSKTNRTSRTPSSIKAKGTKSTKSSKRKLNAVEDMQDVITLDDSPVQSDVSSSEIRHSNRQQKINSKFRDYLHPVKGKVVRPKKEESLSKNVSVKLKAKNGIVKLKGDPRIKDPTVKTKDIKSPIHCSKDVKVGLVDCFEGLTNDLAAIRNQTVSNGNYRADRSTTANSAKRPVSVFGLHGCYSINGIRAMPRKNVTVIGSKRVIVRGNKSSVIESPRRGNNSRSAIDSPLRGNRSSSLIDSITRGNRSSSPIDSPTRGNRSQSLIDSPTRDNRSSASIDSPTRGNRSSSLIDSLTSGNRSSLINSPTRATRGNRPVTNSPTHGSKSQSVNDSPIRGNKSYVKDFHIRGNNSSANKTLQNLQSSKSKNNTSSHTNLRTKKSPTLSLRSRSKRQLSTLPSVSRKRKRSESSKLSTSSNDSPPNVVKQLLSGYVKPNPVVLLPRSLSITSKTPILNSVTVKPAVKRTVSSEHDSPAAKRQKMHLNFNRKSIRIRKLTPRAALSQSGNESSNQGNERNQWRGNSNEVIRKLYPFRKSVTIVSPSSNNATPSPVSSPSSSSNHASPNAPARITTAPTQSIQKKRRGRNPGLTKPQEKEDKPKLESQEAVRDTLKKFLIMGTKVANAISEALKHNEEVLLSKSSTFEKKCLSLVRALAMQGADLEEDDMDKVLKVLDEEQEERKQYRNTFIESLKVSHVTNMALYSQMLRLLKTL